MWTVTILRRPSLWLWLSLACLGLLPASADAQTQVYEISKGSGTVRNVLVNTVVVNVDSSTRTVPGRVSIEVYNDDSANTVFCGLSSDVSSTATSNNYGRRVAPRASIIWSIPESMKVWCVSDGGSGGARLVLTQL